MRNPKSMSVVGALTIFVVIIIIGNVGCSRQTVGKSASNAAAASEPGATQIQQSSLPEKKDETADWPSYVNPHGKFSLRHPKNWAVGPKNPQACTPPIGFFAAGAEADMVLECATEFDGQIFIHSKEGNHLSKYRLATSYYPHQNMTSRKVTVDDVEGTRQSGTAMGQFDDRFVMPGLPDLTKVVVYSFYAHGRTYVAQYNQRIDDPDILPDFDLMVTRTLKFSN
jgi:hypothetical protein